MSDECWLLSWRRCANWNRYIGSSMDRNGSEDGTEEWPSLRGTGVRGGAATCGCCESGGTGPGVMGASG